MLGRRQPPPAVPAGYQLVPVTRRGLPAWPLKASAVMMIGFAVHGDAPAGVGVVLAAVLASWGLIVGIPARWRAARAETPVPRLWPRLWPLWSGALVTAASAAARWPGPAAGGTAVALVGAGVLWWRLRERPEPVEEVAEDVAIWREVVADGPDAALPGSEVSDQVTVLATPDGRDCGVRLRVWGSGPKQHADVIRAAAPAIAAAYRTDLAGVTVHGVGDHSQADVEILDQWWVDEQRTDRQVRMLEPTVYDGRTMDTNTGRFHLGDQVADGEPLDGQLYRRGFGGYDIDISGMKGAGKSTAIDLVLGSIMPTGLVVLDAVDLKGGASIPAWRSPAWRWGTTQADGRLAVRRALAVMESRMQIMAAMPQLDPHGRPVLDYKGEPAYGVTVLDPSREHPFYLLLIEEFPQLLTDKETLRLVERYVALMRFAAGGIAVVHQAVAQGPGYGDSQVLRQLLSQGNVIALRNANNAGGMMFGGDANGKTGTVVDLSTIPKDAPGASWTATPAHPKPALLRHPRIADSWAVARRAIPGQLEPATLAAVEALEARAAEAAERAAQGSAPAGAEPEATAEQAATALQRVAEYLDRRRGEEIAPDDIKKDLGLGNTAVHKALVDLAMPGTVPGGHAERLRRGAWTWRAAA